MLRFIIGPIVSMICIVTRGLGPNQLIFERSASHQSCFIEWMTSKLRITALSDDPRLAFREMFEPRIVSVNEQEDKKKNIKSL